MLRIVVLPIVLYLVVVAIVFFGQRSMLFFPTRGHRSTGLAPWIEGGRTIGFCREVPNARTIWLMMHGNAGQAADRDYVLRCMADDESLYVLEYPGYGQREGSPSRASIDQAASEGYRFLRSRHPATPVGVVGESIGSGPACALAREPVAPDKIILVVPFDTLARVAARHFPFLPVKLMLLDRWDNVESLRPFAGPVSIFGASDDGIIPIEHARELARRAPQAQFIVISGGHNDWSHGGEVRIRR